ncbi:MAG: hypothetical protein ACYDG4_15570 [Desulfuromonadaceae bacterium]
MLTTNLNELRQKIAELYPKRDRGDLKERDFQAKVAEQTVALYRAIIKERMAEGETIECEHHTIWTHFRLMSSILREPAQQATSLFLTDRSLYRVQSTIMPNQPPTADSRDQTGVEVFRLDRIHALKKRLQIRLGEVLMGAAFCAVAVVFRSWLTITAPFLAGLGILGVLHGLLRPTRWIEVELVNGSKTSEPILIHTVRKKSAKELVRRLQERLRLSCPA